MSETNPLVPATTEELEVADDFLSSLTHLAFASGAKAPEQESKRKWKSKFFFQISDSVAAEVEAKRQRFKPKVLKHIDQEIEDRLAEYKSEIPNDLKANIVDVREFFLREIAPVTFAAGAGANQALDVARRLLNSDIDSTQFDKFERMMAIAVDIKMARFVSRQLGMTKAEAEVILARMNPPRPQLIPVGVPNGNAGQERKEEAQKAKDVR